jgi:hypothetical protein
MTKMKDYILSLVIILSIGFSAYSQIDKDQLALEVSKVDSENTMKLKAYIWKLHADVQGEDGNKTKLISEFKYNEDGQLDIKLVDAETNIKKKPGLRGKMQKNAVESKVEYLTKAMKYALTYTYMSKGQLLDFFDKAELSEKGGVITAKGHNIYVEGDELIILIDAETKLYINKRFSTLMDEDPISGEVNYDTFKSSGVNHVTTTKLYMPAENISIVGENKDYTVRID